MAGYMTKLQGYVYDGEHIAATDLNNGDFVEINANGKVAKVAAAVDTTLRVVEKEGPYGLKGLRLIVATQGAKEVFLVENLPEAERDYEKAEYTSKAGEFVRKHRLLAGEQLQVTTTDELFDTVAVGDILTIGIDGELAVKT